MDLQHQQQTPRRKELRCNAAFLVSSGRSFPGKEFTTASAPIFGISVGTKPVELLSDPSQRFIDSQLSTTVSS